MKRSKGLHFAIVLVCMLAVFIGVQLPASANEGAMFKFIEQDGELYITECLITEGTIEIPSEIDGKPVVGIFSFDGRGSIERLVIPNSIRTIKEGAFENSHWIHEVSVAEDNQYYCDVDGVLYDKAVETLVFFPGGYEGEYMIPATVTNFDAIKTGLYNDLNITVEEGSESFITIEDVTYTTDMTRVVYCNMRKTGDYIMPDTVTEIDENVFDACYISSVKISDNLVKIPKGAFSDCFAIERVVLSEGLEEIGERAFKHCTMLTEIIIPDSVKYIGEGAFASCSRMRSAVVGSNVNEIKANVFNGCTKLKKVVLKNENVTIGDFAFYNCALEEMNLENICGRIGEWAFASNDEFINIALPEGVTEIGHCAFATCEKLSKIEIPSSVSSIENVPFHDCYNLTTIDVNSNNSYYSSIGGVLFNKNATELIWCPKQDTYIYEVPKMVSRIMPAAFECSSVDGVRIVNNDITLDNYSVGYAWSTHDQDGNNVYEPIDMMIYCNEGSNAHVYALENEVEFILEDVDGNPFVDIFESNYYYNAVRWALKNNITAGKDATHFAPNGSCTRAQVVAFLWRANGRPEPTITENPFVDVSESSYYYKAVLWALENEITEGTDATHFSPDETVTRAQFVTFLWRAAGRPATMIENPFVDVPEDTYYTEAIVWAMETGVTAGKDATHFAPSSNCTRAQVVTFLYRAYK